MDEVDVKRVRQESHLLGRQMVHDPRSRRFALDLGIDRKKWRTRNIRVIDPTPNPEQTVGNCTGCQKAMAFNAVGTRTRLVVHDMGFADRIYSWASANDPWEGQWPPDDTGSSGLAAARAAQAAGIGGEYRWLFGGADEVVQAIQEGWTVGVGTWWYEGGMRPFPGELGPQIEMTGRRIGGHQYTIRGYNRKHDLVLGRCWWGDFRDFWMKREHLNDLLMDDGDANVQDRVW
jgi:hypothetical protein